MGRAELLATLFLAVFMLRQMDAPWWFVSGAVLVVLGIYAVSEAGGA